MRPALDVGSEAAEPFHDVGHSEFALEQNLGFLTSFSVAESKQMI